MYVDLRRDSAFSETAFHYVLGQSGVIDGIYIIFNIVTHIKISSAVNNIILCFN